MPSSTDAFSGQFAASDEAKRMMKDLTEYAGLFSKMQDIWRWGAALGLREGIEIDEKISKQKRTTIYAIDTIDPEGIFSAIMLSLFPEMRPEERRKKLEDYAELGIREIYRKYKNGTLVFYNIMKEILEKNEEG